jgi:Fic family protein
MQNDYFILSNTTVLLKEYKIATEGISFSDSFNKLKESEMSTETFNFYTSVASIASSKIEGETLEIDSYLKHKMLAIEYQKDLVEKPNDLYQAYLFAQNNSLTKANFCKSHVLISKHLLPKNKQGICRTANMVVMEHKTFRIQYEAAPANEVALLFENFWFELEKLKKRRLTIQEVFYFASLIHLVFVNVHPFEDGNGRAARLLEKWFIAEKLGEKAWFLQSELNYYKNVDAYYKNLNRLGVFYDQLDYSKALPFILMLSKSM